MRMRWVLVGLATLAGCMCQPEKKEEEKTTCAADSECSDGKVCEPVAGSSDKKCAAPLEVRGIVKNEDSDAPIEGAEVLALDASGTPASTTVVTGADGKFALRISTTRDGEGRPQDRSVTLRSAAQGYEPFPNALRHALPIQLSLASNADGTYGYEGDLSTILLAPVEDASGLGRIKGHITGELTKGGVLVTAATGTTPTGLTGISGDDGSYTVFNVPAGTYSVRGYTSGHNLTPAMNVVVTSGGTTENVDLAKSDTPTATVSGDVTPVAGGCTQGTSVVLIPRETLLPTTDFPLNALSTIRAEVPRGLRAPPTGTPNISGAYTITGVPDGTYEVLAAYENDPDPCVFDPSNIGGAFLVQEITVPSSAGGREISVTSFKVTGAVPIVGPGSGADPEAVMSLTPTFSWTGVSSSKNYQVAVYDSAGRRIWATTACADDANGCSTTSITYGTAGAGTTDPAMAPALVADDVYQWRVVALGSRNGASCGFSGIELTNDRECIAISEDLRGLFRTP